MKNTTGLEIIQRAATTDTFSPIAVFKEVGKHRTQLHCVFASTVTSMQRIRAGDDRLVGIYDRNSCPRQIKADIKAVFG